MSAENPATLETLELEALRNLEAEADQWFDALCSLVVFMREALPLFFRCHRSGQFEPADAGDAGKLLDLMAYEEMSLGEDCPVSAELSQKLGYDERADDDRITDQYESRAWRRAELARISAAHPLEEASNVTTAAAQQR